MIRIELSHDEIRAGDQLTGQVVWSSQGGKEPRQLEVLCRWRVEGERDREETIGQEIELELSSKSQVSIPLDFEIPLLGPLSYEGKLFRIIWEVVARADLPFARDEVESRAFRVVPSVWRPELWEIADEEDEDFNEDQSEEL